MIFFIAFSDFLRNMYIHPLLPVSLFLSCSGVGNFSCQMGLQKADFFCKFVNIKLWPSLKSDFRHYQT